MDYTFYEDYQQTKERLAILESLVEKMLMEENEEIEENNSEIKKEEEIQPPTKPNYEAERENPLGDD